MTRRWIAVATATLLLGTNPALAQWIGPEQLEIVEGSGGIDPDTGFVRITGEVRNRSNRTLEQPQVIVELFDASGKPIEVTGFLAETKQEAGVDLRDSVLTERTWLAPGEVAVFEYLRDPQKLGGKRYGSHRLLAKARMAEGPAPRVAVEGFRHAGDA